MAEHPTPPSPAAPAALVPLRGLAAKASSILGRNARLYSPMNIFDGSPATCWNSDQGSPQWLEVSLGCAAPGAGGGAASAAAPAAPVHLRELRLVFQGGFVGQACVARTSTEAEGAAWDACAAFDLEDTSSEQVFALHADGVRRLRLEFGASTDFYGRVTIYTLAVMGFQAGAAS